MKDLKDIVISKVDFRLIGLLLDGTDFHGVDYDKNVSLLKYGFVYNSLTSEVISTYPEYVWDEMKTPMHFGVSTISKDKIDETFNLESVQILTETNVTLPDWNELCDSYKINLIENSTGGLELSNRPMTLDTSNLVEYLKTKQ